MKTNPLTALVRFLTAHRRLVATAAAMACAFALATIATGRHEVLVTVVTTAARMEAGHMITASDLTTVSAPSHVLPEGAVSGAEEAVGRMLAATLSRGSILTSDNLVSESGHTAAPGHLILPIHLASSEVVDLVRPGDRVALIVTDASSRETTIIEDVLIVAIPEASNDGLFGSGGGADYILVDVPQATAKLLAGSSVTSTVTIALQ